MQPKKWAQLGSLGWAKPRPNPIFSFHLLGSPKPGSCRWPSSLLLLSCLKQPGVSATDDRPSAYRRQRPPHPSSSPSFFLCFFFPFFYFLSSPLFPVTMPSLEVARPTDKGRSDSTKHLPDVGRTRGPWRGPNEPTGTPPGLNQAELKRLLLSKRATRRPSSLLPGYLEQPSVSNAGDWPSADRHCRPSLPAVPPLLLSFLFFFSSSSPSFFSSFFSSVFHHYAFPQWHSRPGKAAQTPTDASLAPIGPEACGLGLTSQRAHRRTQTKWESKWLPLSKRAARRPSSLPLLGCLEWPGVSPGSDRPVSTATANHPSTSPSFFFSHHRAFLGGGTADQGRPLGPHRTPPRHR